MYRARVMKSRGGKSVGLGWTDLFPLQIDQIQRKQFVARLAIVVITAEYDLYMALATIFVHESRLNPDVRYHFVAP